MINLILNEELINKKEIIYTFYFLTERFEDEVKISKNFDNNSLNIYYGFSEIFSDAINIPNTLMKNTGEMYFNESKDGVYASFEKNINSPYYVRNGAITFNYDVFSISAYLITCGEEYEISRKDELERFISGFSKRSKFINVPFFDVNSIFLFEALKELNPKLNLKERKTKFFLTHDVDSLNSRNIYVFIHNLKELLLNRKKPFSEKFRIVYKDILQNRHLQIDNYIELEKSLNAGSEFYFIEGKKHRLGKRYELSDIKKQIEALKNNSEFRIGIHTNFFSYDDENLIKSEIDSIEAAVGLEVKSGRNHYLRFKVPDTWIKLSAAGVKCDSTIGYSDENGLRAGTVQAFIPFNKENNELIDIYEVPMIVMDGIIMEKDISFEEKWKEIQALIDYSFKYKGTVSILWHQRVILDEKYKKMYTRILSYINENNGSFILSDELINDYNEHKNKITKLLSEV